MGERIAGAAPDLQKLVQRYGGYSKIPAGEWERYDADVLAVWDRHNRLHEPRGKFPMTLASYPTTTSRLWRPWGKDFSAEDKAARSGRDI